MADIGTLQRATLAARQRTGNDAISTAVECGLFQVNLVRYVDNDSEVTPLSDWLTIDKACAFLNAMNT